MLAHSFEALTNGDVRLTITLDMSADVAATPGPEVLERWSLDEVRFDPAVLQFKSVVLGQFYTGVTAQDRANDGVLTLRNIAIQSGVASNRTGMVTLARVTFSPVGARGARTTTRTLVGSVIGSVVETGGFNYTSLVRVSEGTYAIP